MKLFVYRSLLLLLALPLFLVGSTSAAENSQLRVTLESPAGTMRMGDTPSFSGSVTNIGKTPLEGLVVYLSLVSLQPGKEEPVDLEDWSAEKAIRIGRLSPTETSAHQWKIRLIQAGTYGVALTVIDPIEQQPVVSRVVRFDIQPKPMLASKRILPVAIGEPLLLLLILGAMGLFGGQMKLVRRISAAKP